MAAACVSDEVDIDATMEKLLHIDAPRDEDVIVVERGTKKRRSVLVADVSASVDEERLIVSAATIGALSAVFSRDSVGVVAFWSDAIVLQTCQNRRNPFDMVDDLLALEAEGLTNVAHGLETGIELLGPVVYRDSRVILLSDCLHNAGPDPRPQAETAPRLDVLVDVIGTHDLDLATDLAIAGRGLCRAVRTAADVAVAAIDLLRQPSP